MQSHGDIPFSKREDQRPETAGTKAVPTDQVRRTVNVLVGVYVLAHGTVHALTVVRALRASVGCFNRWAKSHIANEVCVEGPAARATRYHSRP